MQIQKTEILTLSSKNINESDITCTALSLEFGKIYFIFKGLLKSKRRSVCVREPGAVSEVLFYRRENKTEFYISEYTLISSPEKIRRDLQVYYFHCFLLELISKISTENTKSQFIYNMSKKVISILETDDNPLMLTLFFVLHVLQHHGIIPDLSKCENCGNDDASHYNFNFNDKNLLCRECTPEYNKEKFSLEAGTMNFLNNSLKSKYHENDFTVISRIEAEKSLFYLILFIEDYYQIVINSKDFIFNK